MRKVILAAALIVSLAGNTLAAERTPTREKLDDMAKRVMVTDLDIANMLESKEFLMKNFDKDGMAEILMQLKDLLKINAEMIDRIMRVM